MESVTIIDDSRVGSGRQRRFACVEMASKSEGETAIANLEGKKMGYSDLTIIRALSLTDRQQIVTFNTRSNKEFTTGRKKKLKI